MSYIACSGCKQNMYYVTSGHYYLNAAYNMCNNCVTNSNAITHVKNYHKLIQKSSFDSMLQQKIKEIQKLNQSYLDEYFKYGEGLKNFISDKLANYMSQYNKYIQNIKTKEPCLTRFVTQSIERTLSQVERGILTIIGREAQNISQNVSIENQDNEKRIKASEAYREKRRAEMTVYSITTSHSKTGCKNKDDNPEIRQFIYNKNEVAAVMKILEANIEGYKTTGVTLSKLIQEGQRIYDELIREQKVAMNKSVTTEVSENSSIILQKVE